MGQATSRVHIQHVLLSLQPGGLENGVVNVVNRLDPARFQSSLCCLKIAGEFAARVKRDDIAIHEFGWRGGNDIGLAWRLAKMFKQTRTDIVHTRNAEAFFYGFLGAKLAGVPHLIHSEHGRTFNDRRIRFFAQRQMSRFTDAIFAVSDQLKRDLVGHIGIPPSRIEVLYNGVDLQRFKSVDRASIHAEWGVRPGEVVVGSVGRLVPVKNYPLLLRAVQAVPGCKLVLIGDGPERSGLTALAESLGIVDRVRFLGHREDVGSLLGAFDVFVLPSFSEGMSNTLLEAMAAGVAAVASDVGGNGEIVRHEETGLLFPSDDLSVLRGHLERLTADAALRARFAENGRRRALQAFDIGAMIKRYEDLYERVASTTRG